MLLMSYLGRYTAQLYQQKYGQHLVFERTSSAQGYLKWMIIFGIFCITAMLAFAYYAQELAASVLWGLAWSLPAYQLGVQIARYSLFQYVIKHPSEISGVTHFKPRLVHMIGFCVTLQPTILLLIMALFSGDLFIVGAAVGCCCWTLLQAFNVLATPIF